MLTPKPIEVVERIKATPDLTDEEAAVWAATVSAYPADWFTGGNAPLLGQLCRHTIHARRISSLIERTVAGTQFEIGEYDLLLKMLERESRAMASLQTKLRLTPQATTNHRGNKQSVVTLDPWEFQG
jgi:hypothetical protein